MLRASLISITLFISGVATAGDVLEYNVHIPATSNSCDGEAKALGARFTASTGVQVQSAICVTAVTFASEKKSYTLYSLRLTYDSQYSPRRYSATYGRNSQENSIGNVVGAYGSYASCIKELEKQTTAFETNTGLKAVASYCAPSASGGVSPNYILQVDGFGNPQSVLRVFYPSALDVDKDIFSWSESMLKTEGGSIARVAPREIFYYNSSEIPLHYEVLEVFSDNKTCQAQLVEAEDFMHQLKARLFHLDCTQSGASVVLRSLRIGTNMISRDQSVSSYHYYSLDECLADRTHIKSLAFSRNWRGQGAFCHNAIGADGGYYPEILGLY